MREEHGMDALPPARCHCAIDYECDACKAYTAEEGMLRDVTRMVVAGDAHADVADMKEYLRLNPYLPHVITIQKELKALDLRIKHIERNIRLNEGKLATVRRKRIQVEARLAEYTQYVEAFAANGGMHDPSHV